MPIRAKLVIVVFVFAILPMFLLWGRWQGTAVGTITNLLKRDAETRAAEIDVHLSRALKTHQAQLARLTQTPLSKSYARTLAFNQRAVPDGAWQELSLFALTQQQPYSALVCFNRAGQPLGKLEIQAGANGLPQPFFSEQGFTAADAVQSAVARDRGGFGVSEVETNGAAAHVWLLAPLPDDTGQPAGALAARVRIEQLLREAAGPPPPPATANDNNLTSARQESVVLSPAGTVLYAADPAKHGQPYEQAFAPLAAPFAQLLQNGQGEQSLDDWVMHYRARAAAPMLSILVLANYDNAIAGLERDSITMLFVTALMATVAALTLYYLISNITDSIRRITRGAKAIAAGELNHQIVVQTNDGRVLAHTFNRMAAKLREMLKKEGEQKQFESFARLSAVLTHDLKNQILSLSLLVNNMEKKFHREGFREDAMRTLSDTVDNLQNLVAKLSDPRTPTKRVREQANLTQLVERVLHRTAEQAAGKYHVTAKLTPDVKATVDGKAIERVIENLVINALESMPDGGKLFVLTSVEQAHAIISITDTGKGMTEDFMRTRLFQPFATTKKKGIGLGLYSCRDIIEQHGGRIDVHSQVEVGTEFRVVLPLVREERQPAR